ncbi:MAG: hypothetical protein RIC03_16225 [Cyclobacteriaceae bacterium]
MKTVIKIFLIIIITVCCQTLSLAQGDYNNSITLQGGLSMAHLFMLQDVGLVDAETYGSYEKGNLPGVFARWEHGRAVSVSFDLGINKSEFTYTPRPGNFGGGEYSSKSTYTGIGYHFGTRFVGHLLENKLGRKLINGEGEPKVDLYLGLGFYFGGWSYTPEKEWDSEGTGFQIGLPLIIGGRYYFSDRFGMCLEATSYMNNMLNIGLSYRFETL